MGLLDDLGEPKKFIPSCKIRNIAATLDEADGKIFISAVNDAKWPVAQLALALRERGITLTRETIRTHRNGLCSCSKI